MRFSPWIIFIVMFISFVYSTQLCQPRISVYLPGVFSPSYGHCDRNRLAKGLGFAIPSTERSKFILGALEDPLIIFKISSNSVPSPLSQVMIKCLAK